MTAHQEAGTAPVVVVRDQHGVIVCAYLEEATAEALCRHRKGWTFEWYEPRSSLTAAREALEAKEEVLEALKNGDSTLLTGVVNWPGGTDIGLQSPLVAIMTDSLAKMIGDHNYVELRMKHQTTGEEFTVNCQRTFRPTPHEKRIAAEERAATAEAALAGVRELVPSDVVLHSIRSFLDYGEQTFDKPGGHKGYFSSGFAGHTLREYLARVEAPPSSGSPAEGAA